MHHHQINVSSLPSGTSVLLLRGLSLGGFESSTGLIMR